MTLPNLAPNWAVLKHPYNWFVVAFALLILVLIIHIGVKGFNPVAAIEGA